MGVGVACDHVPVTHHLTAQLDFETVDFVALATGFVIFLALGSARHGIVDFRHIVLLAPEYCRRQVEAFLQETALQAQFIVTAHYRLKVGVAGILVGGWLEDVGVTGVDRQLVGEVIEHAGIGRNDVILGLGNFGPAERSRVVFNERRGGVGALPTAIPGAQYGMPLIGQVKARGQVTGLLLDDVMTSFNAGIEVLILGDRTHVSPVGDFVVIIGVEINHQRRGVVVLGLAVTHHQFVITPEQRVSARDIDVDGGHLLFADKMAGIGRHPRAIGVGETAASVIHLALGIAGAMGIGRL